MLPSAFSIAHRGNRGAAHVIGAGGLGDGRQLALAAERRQRGHRGHRDRGIVLRRLLDQLAERVIAHAAVGLVADDVREHRRHRRCAPRRRGARARRCRPWRTRSATRGRAGRARGSLRCGCWGRGAWTWIAGGACREFPWVVQTPAAPRAAGRCLPLRCVAVSGPSRSDRALESGKDGIIARLRCTACIGHRTCISITNLH